MLNLISCNTHDELGRTGAERAAEAIRRAHAEGREARVLLAAAPSQIPVLTQLAAIDIHSEPVTYFHMDEYVGLDPSAPQAFGTWLERHYFSLLPAGHRATFTRISTSGSPADSAAAYASQLPEGEFDLVLCGIGINGHLAFNDPGCDLDDPEPVRHIRLATASRQQQVDEGLFAGLDDVPEHAITLTVPRMLASRTLVCSVLGEAKAAATKEMMEREVTNELPATAIKKHPDATVLADEEALSHVR